MDNNPNSSLAMASSIPDVLDEQDNIIERGRIKNPAQLSGAYQYLFTSDLGSSRARAKVQSQVDGDPPFSSDQDRLLGLGGRTNANWGYASQSQQDIERPYNDVFDSIDVFGTTPLRAGFADELTRQQWAPIIAEEISRMIRNWPKFTYNRLLCVHLFTMFGVAFTYREDKFDWRFKVTSLQWLKVPRRTEATIEDQDFFCARVYMSPVELQKKIKDPVAAELAGWNVEAVKSAIEETAQPTAIDTSNPETLQETVKDQDYFSGAGAITVDLVHGWVREMDGSISHVIGRYDGEGDFLYKCEGMYGSMSEFVTAYTDGVGSNGDFYSIRGNAWRGFNSSLYLNLMTCKAVDMANWSSTPHIKATDEDALIDTLIRPAGPYNLISSQAEFVEIEHVPFQQNLIPMIQEIKGIFGMRSRQAGGSQRYTGGATPRTAEEVKTEAAIDGQLTTAGMDLYFLSWLNDFKEIVRRVCSRDLSASHPGGAEAFKMRKRCLERGVPIEAIYNVDVDAIEINRGVGKGSAQERRAVFSQLMPNANTRPRWQGPVSPTCSSHRNPAPGHPWTCRSPTWRTLSCHWASQPPLSRTKTTRSMWPPICPSWPRSTVLWPTSRCSSHRPSSCSVPSGVTPPSTWLTSTRRTRCTSPSRKPCPRLKKWWSTVRRSSQPRPSGHRRTLKPLPGILSKHRSRC